MAVPSFEVGIAHPLLRDRSGRGISVAVIDSGIHLGHPHIGRIAGGVAFADDGTRHDDFVDRLGHGTAVAAAIHEKAPDAEIHIVKVFDRALATNVETLVAALDWAAEGRIRLVNLSLGTANPENRPALEKAVERVRRSGSILISAAGFGSRPWYPGSLDGVVGVDLDPGCPRDALRATPRKTLSIAASGFARPIPGVPPERNLNGISFSVANACGLLARLLEARGDVRTAEAARAALLEGDGGTG